MTLFYDPVTTPVDAQGDPYAGAKRYFYLAGTLTPATVYADAARTTALSNPVVANASGQFVPIYLDPAVSYRTILRDASDVLLRDNDSITASTLSQAGVGAALYPRTATEIAALVTPSSYVYPFGDARRYGYSTDLSVDSTTAVQSALDLVAAGGGGRVTLPPGGACKVTSVLSLPSNVVLDLNGGTIWQYTSNIAIVKVATNATRWGVENGLLRYYVQQTTAETGAIGLQLATASSTTYLGRISGVTVDKAYRGFGLPNLTACYSFLVNFDTCLAYECSDYGWYIQGDTSSGGATNIRLDNCWVLQPTGSEQATSKGYAFRGVSQLSIGNIATDHIQEQYGLWLENCTGSIGTFLAESCEWTASSGVNAMVLIDGSVMDIGLIGAAANTVTISGTADWAGIRLATAAVLDLSVYRDVNTAVTDTSSGAYYAVYCSSTGNRSRIYQATAAGTTPALAYTDASWPRQIEWLNGAESAILTGSVAWTPAEILDGDEEVKEITVTGAALGDYCDVSYSADVADLTLTGQVTAADTVTAQLSNNTGGSLTATAGTVYARVRRRA